MGSFKTVAIADAVAMMLSHEARMYFRSPNAMDSKRVAEDRPTSTAWSAHDALLIASSSRSQMIMNTMNSYFSMLCCKRFWNHFFPWHLWHCHVQLIDDVYHIYPNPIITSKQLYMSKNTNIIVINWHTTIAICNKNKHQQTFLSKCILTHCLQQSLFKNSRTWKCKHTAITVPSDYVSIEYITNICP